MKSIEFRYHSFTVSGVMKDLQNSHIQADAIFSLESIPVQFPNRNLNNVTGNSWLWSATYLLMPVDLNVIEAEKKINNVLTEINDFNRFNIEFRRFHLRALKDIYFKGAVRNLDFGLHGNLQVIQVLVAVAFFIILVVCINYINLTTARASLRAREVGVKRVAGSSILLLRGQLVMESTLVAFISFLIAMTMVQIFLSRFNLLAGTDFQLTDLNNPKVLLLSLFGVLSLGIVSGIYPAFHLTAAKPVMLMKGHLSGESKGVRLRTGLMTCQFAISIILIVGMLCCLRQLEYIEAMDLGFDKEQIITASTPADFPEEFTLRETLKDRLLQHPQILKVTYSAGNPGEAIPTSVMEIDGVKRTTGLIGLDPDYLDVMNIPVIEGSNFSWAVEGDRFRRGDTRGSVLLNETAVREFGLDSPVGKSIKWDITAAKVIGVVRDFHFRSLHHKIEPLFFVWAGPFHLCSIKISSSNVPATVKIISEEWRKIYGSTPFDYHFLDETLDQKYRSDQQMTTVIGYFAALAIMLAALGLFALSSFMVTRRTKEIGIRKSLGARPVMIYFMLSWGFLKWIFWAVVISSPVAFFLMNMWLDSFAYHIEIEPDIFVMAASLTLIVSLLTVTWQALKAAYANPVKALRYE